MKRWVLFLVAALAVGCGGGGGSSTPAPAAFSPVGVWAGTIGPTGSAVNVNVVVFPDGTFHYAANNYFMASGTFTLNGSTAVGDGTIAYDPGSNLGPSPVHVVCTGVSQKSMTGTYTAQISNYTTDSGAINLAYFPAAGSPIQLPDLAGSYNDDGTNIAGHGAVSMTVDSSGDITGLYGGGIGTYKGTITQPVPGVNAFKVNLIFSITQVSTTYSYTLQGAAFFDPAGKRLYIQAFDPAARVYYGYFIGSVLKP